MKKIYKSMLSMFLCIAVALTLFTACGGKAIKYEGSTLPEAKVGQVYTQNIATATGSDDISYQLKEDNTLPAGLTLSAAGVISGTPTSESAEKRFIVVASAGNISAEATFSITVVKGGLVYEGDTLEAVVNTQTKISIATATGAADITYTLKSGVLPAGLSFESDGSIVGTATEINGDGVKIVVTASAEGCEPVEATFTVKVVRPSLSFESGNIASGRVGQYYTAYVKSALKTAASGVTFRMENGSALPAGLSFDNGFIYGTPETRGETKFSVIAEVNGYEPATAEFSLSVRGAAEESGISGSVELKFEGVKELADGYESAEVYLDKGLAEDATASNGNAVVFALADGSSFPGGLELYPNGTIFGTPTKKGNYSFSVIVSAANCTPVTAQYKISIAAKQIVYEAMTLKDAEVGSVYTASVATAVVPDGTPVNYVLASGSTLPAGLTLSPDGTISGTPTQYFMRTYFRVEAQAEGYTAKKATIYITILDKICKVEEGIMEAELTDLRGLTGSGWSGGASDVGMIQMFASASGGRAVGYTYMPNLTLTFRFNAEKAVSDAHLYINLSTEIGNIAISKENFSIKLNGKELDYNTINLTGTTNVVSDFKEFDLGTGHALTEGENVITLTVKDNLLIGGSRIGGPIIDRIRVSTSTNLTWRPYSFNLTAQA